MQIMYARFRREPGNKTHVRLCSNSVGDNQRGGYRAKPAGLCQRGELNPYSQRFNSRLALTPPKPKPFDSA